MVTSTIMPAASMVRIAAGTGGGSIAAGRATIVATIALTIALASGVEAPLGIMLPLVGSTRRPDPPSERMLDRMEERLLRDPVSNKRMARYWPSLKDQFSSIGS